MHINRDLILKLEKLAQLDLSEAERDSLQGELARLLDMVGQIQHLDTAHVAPLRHLGEQPLGWRGDANSPALGQAAQHETGYFKVPKIK